MIGDRTLFQATLDRCSDPQHFAPPLIVAGDAHVALIRQQMGDAAGAEKTRIIVEPSARNTAPAIALAAATLPEDAIMLVCPSDHYIGDTQAFHAAVGKAATLAQDGWMVSFGIEPDAPETGFGYIKRGDVQGGGYRIDRFIEKPDRARAEVFLADGGYSWNGGIFVLRAGSFMDELTVHRPEMAAAIRRAVVDGTRNGMLVHPGAAAFAEIAGELVDYAVMENTSKAAMVPAQMEWSDIGNWAALRSARPADDLGNFTKGAAQLENCTNVMTQTDGPRINAIGLRDVTIIVDGDEVLVIGKGGEQQVGKLDGAANQ